MTARVLIVDDMESNIKLLHVKLLKEYYTIFTARNGIEAIDILSKHKVDVILLDIMMPGMDGFETCIRIKQNPETMYIPIIMITALSDKENRVKAVEAGADELLAKPVSDIELLTRLKSLSRIKNAIDEVKLRNHTNVELGEMVVDFIKLQDNFVDNKILIIDDDIVEAQNIQSALLNLFANISIKPDVRVLDDVVNNVPDIVILSCQFFTEDPLRIIATLRSEECMRYSIIVLLAEEENMPLVIKGMEMGANDYMIFPLDNHELVARLRTQIRRKKYYDYLRNQTESVFNLSIQDVLTGIFNRRYFDFYVKSLVKKSQENGGAFCLLMIDIDDFKNINDTYGHQVGDFVLQNFSSNLKLICRVTDLIARYGGEEFSVLLTNTSLSEAIEVSDRFRSRIASLDIDVPLIQTVLKITASIGVSEYKGGQSVQDFISCADKALYRAKNSGKNKVAVC